MKKFKRDNANIWDVFLAHYRPDEEIVLLYTSQPEASEHFSILAHAPFATVTQRDGVVRINQAKTTLSFSEAVDALRTTKLPELSDWPIQPEILGFVSYEGDPARFSLYDELMLFDHETQQLYVAQFEQTDQAYWLSATSPLPTPQKVPAVRQPAAIFMDQTRQEYMASVEKMRAHMAAGDLYVGNLTQQFDILSDAEPISVFQALVTQNPAPFASFLHYPDWEMTQISSSVERFVAIHDRELTTKPIKGTIARGQTPEEDAQNLAKLANNTKDHAELLMVTDLLRNDVARISEPGHLVVKKLAAVETFAHVHQLVTTIQSRVKADLTFTEFMTAMFPGGSITGTPKKSAQAVIASLEKRPRGIYTGMQGWLNRQLDLDMNIAIRTLAFDGQTYQLGVGGGVTYESDAAAEFDEILVKAQPFLTVFGIETLPTPIFTTGQVKDGQLLNLSAHVTRLARQYHQPDLSQQLQALAAQSPDGVLRVSTDGDTLSATTRPLPPLVGPYRVKLADEAIAPSVLTQYKLSGPTFQKVFHPEVVRAKTQGYQDVLFHTDGVVTELSIGNFLAKRGDTYVTPSTQALPGTYLAEFAKTHHVIYAEIPVSELVNFDAFYMTNAVRGLVAIDLVGI
ncbi:aminodeoxychorismate synthase, component I [Leuconostoc garlicum]|uniref:Aminodeoxychorismate synthase, component I n=1 Tax=Leuconostoc garlicum TaxID=255248 RepID=A0ABM6HUE1_9LACO|nr:aminodeoxychorismate synthase component I [Leuconostoc garlicum]AQN79998.1 aminodeoxychorismate synthase, component I [Leuconostoc garlicum]